MPLPVIIIGGGPVGLVTSIALSHQRIPHLLFERYPGTSIHPKAVGLNARTLEVFRALGLEDEISAAAAPPHSHSKTAWYTSLGPERREILTRDAWGGGIYEDEYKTFSPCRLTVLPQIRLEPILLQRARSLNPRGVFHNAEVDVVREFEDHVAVTVLQKYADGSHEVKTYDAEYVIAADGGRTVGPALEINMSGEENILDMVSAHIRAPLSLIHPDPDVLITWFIDPAKGGSINTGYLYHLGPYNGNIEEEEWMFACATNPVDPKKFEKEDMLRRLNETLQLPKRLKEKIEIPPWGALGLNTGIQDVHNLVWKLAFAIKDREATGRIGMDNLLRTYETERHPIALRVAQTSLSNLRNHALAMDRALGIYPTQSAEENIASLNAYFDEAHRNHGGLRTAVTAAQKVLDSEFHAPGAEVGWFYEIKDFINAGNHNGQLKEDGEFDVSAYHVSTSKGHHMPHFWVVKDGVRKSVRDLIPLDKFVVFAKSPKWSELEDDDYDADYDAVVQILNGEDGHWRDEEGKWEKLPGLRRTDALLVRPDGVIAWNMHEAYCSSEYFDKMFCKEILRRA